MSRLGHVVTSIYGKMVPPHPGRWRIVSSMISFFGLRRPHVVTVKRRGVWFQLNLESYIDVYLYYNGYYDFLETRFLEENLRCGNIFIDVGANIGYYTLLAARKVAPEGRVHAFEISADEFKKLSANVSLNSFASLVHLNRTAVMDTVGEVSITPTFDAGTTFIDVAAEYHGDVVPATTLDQYMEERTFDRVDYLKCDIEGAELKMLKGAKGILSRCRPVILLEINPKALGRFGASVKEVLSELDDYGYSSYCLTKSLTGLGLRKMASKDEPEGDDFMNVVALPRQKLPRVCERLPLRLPVRS